MFSMQLFSFWYQNVNSKGSFAITLTYGQSYGSTYCWIWICLSLSNEFFMKFLTYIHVLFTESHKTTSVISKGIRKHIKNRCRLKTVLVLWGYLTEHSFMCTFKTCITLLSRKFTLNRLKQYNCYLQASLSDGLAMWPARFAFAVKRSTVWCYFFLKYCQLRLIQIHVHVWRCCNTAWCDIVMW